MGVDSLEEFVPAHFGLRLEPLLRSQGYRDLGSVSSEVTAVAREMRAVAEMLARPHVWFGRRRVQRVTRDALVLIDGPTFHGSCFRTQMEKATEVVCFVITLGPALDERVAALSDAGDMLEALFLETAGSVAVQETVRRFRMHLAPRMAADGLRLSSRLGPGYGDWPLTDQESLFGMFPSDLPVRLTDGCIMVPLKSLSGLFGLLPAPVSPRPEPRGGRYG